MSWFPQKKAKMHTVMFIAAVTLAALLQGCGELKQPTPDKFYSETEPPNIQEFRWVNGKAPASFDPALASAPPETDIVRAVFEGLTETDPKTLKALPAIATSWKATDDATVWTFNLRKDATWSNGEKVTAEDFVRSWNRLASMGDKVPLHFLLHNIKGIHGAAKSSSLAASSPAPANSGSGELAGGNPVESQGTEDNKKDIGPTEAAAANPRSRLGVRAVERFILEVTLSEPDEQFPTLVAHPIFRPVYGTGGYFKKEPLAADIVTNGAFRIASVGGEGITLEREDRYFNRDNVTLERVVVVPAEDPDAALAAYKAGRVDAVTNMDFKPLALKILTPYDDFKRTTHSALNFYEFNLTRPPFNDRRVREALAISIDREKLSEGEMEGATHPAFDYLPFDVGRERKLRPDLEKAKRLFATAGFPDGDNFPVVRLLINRNNVQEKIARSVAKMWKSALNVDTELIVMDPKEMEELRSAGEYDLIRRGVVLPTADETANMLALFSTENEFEKAGPSPKGGGTTAGRPEPESKAQSREAPGKSRSEELLIDRGIDEKKVMTEAEAIAAIPAIPLYFPTSYALVKPYVKGFETNTLDAPALKNVFIDNSWQPGAKRKQS